MAKTLSNLQAHVRQYLDEATQADWTDTEVTREINAKYMELYASVVQVFEDYYSTKSTTATVANQQEYALPSDFYKIRRLEVNYAPSQSGSIPRKAVRVELDEVLRDLGNSSLGVTVYRSPCFYIRGSVLGLIPVPTEAGSTALTMWYVKTPTELSSSSDAIDIPFADEYGQIIALGAAGTLLRKGQQEEAVAAQYLKEFEVKKQQMMAELEDRVSDGSKHIVDLIGEDTDFESAFLF